MAILYKHFFIEPDDYVSSSSQIWDVERFMR